MCDDSYHCIQHGAGFTVNAETRAVSCRTLHTEGREDQEIWWQLRMLAFLLLQSTGLAQRKQGRVVASVNPINLMTYNP